MEDLTEPGMNMVEEEKATASLERTAIDKAHNVFGPAENKPVKRQLCAWTSFSSEDFGLTSKDLEEFLENKP